MLETAVMCLAMNMYFEARDQGEEGMMAIAEVTLNRVESSEFPDNVCDVVWQHKQFSWTHDGKSDKMKNKKYADMTYEMAVDYMTGLETDITKGALYYHADYVKPYWSKRTEPVAVLGDHIFYKNIPKK
ncbi:MAG: cell wall hydrolase [Candidatus Thiodiazotropha taylori]|uniref:Cell wall hydrolase n=1 Tax=Candidatus Thiodiazotropha taylori TaxID=2792791 RepID=A0A9E4K9E4_9GAMM|nr:cell wall hydrolase [Candidatus Thiodiazotropha taylori]MCW4255030.1 cell wall hydrolase [Candidatus Thiodiazotropha taylori]